MSTEGKPKRSRTTKTRKDQGAERIKTSVLLSRSVDIKIRALRVSEGSINRPSLTRSWRRPHAACGEPRRPQRRAGQGRARRKRPSESKGTHPQVH